MLSPRLPSYTRWGLQSILSGQRIHNSYTSYRRHYARIATPTTPSPQHPIYISKSTNPYFNLSFEDWLFRHKAPDEPLLLLYRDEPCVVIGRNQNPWKEINLPALRASQSIQLIRRRSGGGTVYHDLGNTNFSIHLPRTSFDRHKTAQIVLRAVRALGIDATVNDRNDICVGKEKICYVPSVLKIGKKRTRNQRAYHHGTMLISTQLNTLGDLLHNTKDTMETKGVASVRSPVRNLQQFNQDATHEGFMNAIVHEFRQEYGIRDAVQTISEDDCKDIEYIQHGILELPSWEWAYGQTPEFTYTLSQAFEWGTARAKIRSKHGTILDFDCSLNFVGFPVPSMSAILQNVVDSGEYRLKEVARILQGRRYGYISATEILRELSITGDAAVVQDVLFWLERTMNG
ncbi:Lipoyltransferase and lipoate-protein ligase [Lentinula aciculospora]|uniref:Putative lipoate-protein ligase A n=1 Tax=Lentinula aciculospora TaxID=153920 RepID=A0A9W9ACT6_9AGAR|nr:Lipoyltransferase and lipoate-protein ligase [Lentinula aciculospora]